MAEGSGAAERPESRESLGEERPSRDVVRRSPDDQEPDELHEEEALP
jgi:hypothetical protein